ncbi:MAG: HD domain-containing protein [Phycisphaerae bacterium]
MAKPAPIVALARDLLVLPGEPGAHDLWLWEHSERVAQIAQQLAELPEVAEMRPNGVALHAAALFHDAGWAVQVRSGHISRWQVLNRPTNDIQRELGAAYLDEHGHRHIPSDVLRLAVEAIRQCNERSTSLIESRVVAEAENLDEIGLLHTLRQFRQHQAEGRPLEQLVQGWQRQQQYQFWEARINDTLRFTASKQLARQRLATVEQFMSGLERVRCIADVRDALQQPD